MAVNSSDMIDNDLYKVIPQSNKFTPKYVYLTVEQRNEVTIKSVLRQLGFKPNQYDFRYHCTILYNDNENSPKKDFSVELKRPIDNIIIDSVGILGDYVVLYISSPEVNMIRGEFDRLGFESKHDGFIPHISILKDTIPYADMKRLEDNLSRIKSTNIRLMEIVYHNNNIKHYG